MKHLLILFYCMITGLLCSQRSIEHLSVGRTLMQKAVTDDHLYFSGGNAGYTCQTEVDVFDASGQVSQVLHLPQGKKGHASAANDSLVFFAGGQEITGYSNSVYIYNENTSQWSTILMPHFHNAFAAVHSNGKVYFAGGSNNSVPSNVVDIYDIATNTFTETQLSLARANLHGIALNNKIYFAGGRNMGTITDVIDVYDELSQTWSVLHMPVSRNEFGMTTDGTKLYFAGGEQGLGSSLTTVSRQMDIYDPVQNTWETTFFPQERRGLDNALAFGCGRIYLAGGSTPDMVKFNILDIYNIATKTWFRDTITRAREALCCEVLGDKLFVAGGYTGSLSYSDVVDVIDVCYTIPGPKPGPSIFDTTGLAISIIPNIFTPNNDNINDNWAFIMKADQPSSIEIYNRWGQVVKTMSSDKVGNYLYLVKWDGKSLDGFDRPDGVYYYQITYHDNGSTDLKKIHGFITLLR